MQHRGAEWVPHLSPSTDILGTPVDGRVNSNLQKSWSIHSCPLIGESLYFGWPDRPDESGETRFLHQQANQWCGATPKTYILCLAQGLPYGTHPRNQNSHSC